MKKIIAIVALFCLAVIPGFASSSSESSKHLSVPLQEAHDSLLNLVDWKFAGDPENAGQKNSWAETAFDDSHWKNLNATDVWQKQGFPQYHGIAWYRYKFNVPADWKNSKVIFHSEGIKCEYDLYLNGKLVRHFGSKEIPTSDVPTEADISVNLLAGLPNVIAVRVDDQGKEGGIWQRTQIRRIPDMDRFRNLLPFPVFQSHPELVDLYWQTWKMAWQKIAFGDLQNGFVPAFMEEGYSGLIFQWDSVFISMYGRYGRRLFPAMPTLDNFYLKQTPDGYIQRIYSKTSGKQVVDLTPTCAMTNPPIFAWSEWDYYKITGDSSRLPRVFPILSKYYQWIKDHQSSKLVQGMYWQTDWESGMDNMPRPNMELAGCVDMSLQQALSAKYLALIAHQLGDKEKEEYWLREFEGLKATINKLAWDENDGIYYDVDKAMHHTGVKHIGAMWSLISDVASPHQAELLVKHLKDPKEFYRHHLFPALAASDPRYTAEASYWAGGVWAPTDYMTIKGLAQYGYDDFAREAALNHVGNMAAVYASNIDTRHIDPNEADGDYHTIWECYNPDKVCPCTRADKYYFGRQDFAGWTGIGPISLMIEQLIGLEILGSENRIVWNLAEPGRVGLKNFELGSENIVSLEAEPASGDKRIITVEASRPFDLKVKCGNKTTDHRVPAGKSKLELALK